ncbi:MAG TPA: hypothetical protein VN581_03455, partial [Patescibacteria group bacterium]|nr:hypothetical protein [Patescibacteria group bacterium]
MIRKSQLFLAVAALVGMNAAMAACNTTQWGQGSPPGGAVVGTPLAADPVATGVGGDNTEVARYSGKCGMGSTAVGQYVQDGLPLAEGGYIVRFYVRPTITSGEAVVMNAMADEAPDYAIFKVAYDGAAQQIKVYGSNGSGGFLGTVSSFPAARGRWHAVEVAYARGAGTNTGTLNSSVIGGRNFNVPEFGTAATASIPAVAIAASGDGVDFAQFGWVSGAASGGGITVDAFESRRSTAIGFLQRG